MEHPGLQQDRTRVEFKAVVNNTSKARLVEFKTGFQVWVPLSMGTIHWGLGKTKDVIDIETWFYEKRIAEELR